MFVSSIRLVQIDALRMVWGTAVGGDCRCWRSVVALL